MTAALLTSALGIIGSLLLAAFIYWSAKRRDTEAEWRKEKLTYYKAFIESMRYR
jgi:hypothetical protein